MWKGRDIISILDFSRIDLEELFERTDYILGRDLRDRPLDGKIMASAFFEPSTRTRLSFESAMLRLGGSTIGFAEVGTSSQAKDENFADTIKMLDNYSDVMVIRHPLEGAARFAAEISNNPVVNAGDGKREHPTQAMLDLYAVKKNFGKIDGLTYCVLGDLKYSRAAASFVLGLTRFNPNNIYLISPLQLSLRDEIKDHLSMLNIKFDEKMELREALPEVDVLYVTRIQRERFPDLREYEALKDSYVVNAKMLENAKTNLAILHPLPRVNELSHDVDKTKMAKYFEQARLGVYVRMALLRLIFGV
ncbi:MAG: aspartate carbamoyltransferase [Candidatus Bathyarchaeia archaeon]